MGRLIWKPSPNANFTDKMFLVLFSVATVAVLVSPGRVKLPWLIVAVNTICFLLVAGLARAARQSRLWRFLHDWYPLGIFIVCFEEASRLSFVVRDAWQDHYLLALESRLFAVPPTVWLGRHGSPLLTEILEIGYFSYFVLLMIVGGALYPWPDKRPFRQLMDATVLSYSLCYLVFALFPTEGPAHTLAAQHNFAIPGGGPFHWIVGLIQENAGVHGNAFPSAHVAGAVVALFYAWRYTPRLGSGLTPLVALLGVGAVYDRYHYASDVVAGIFFGLIPAWLVLRGWVGTAPEVTARSWLVLRQ